QETHISQQRGSGTDEGTGYKPGVPDVSSDDSEEEISWNSFDDEDVGGHEEGDKSDERDEGSDDDSDETVKAGTGKDDDDNDEEEELAKSDEEDTETGKGGDEVRESEDYGHIKWIEELVPRAMWIQQPIDYNKHALWGVSHWGRKRQQFYRYAVNRESALVVYSKRRIIAVTELKIVEWHDYKHLDWILVRRDDDKIFKFKEGYLKRLRLQDIEDILLLLVQGKLSNLTIEEHFAFNVSLRMFTRSIVINRRVEDL
nr:hypothetical protein [Tanacetum cinerariifolium]